MAMLHVAIRRLALPAVLLLVSALLINGCDRRLALLAADRGADGQRTTREGRGRRPANRSFVGEIERQIGWVAYAQFASLPADQRRFDYVRLLRQVPAITSPDAA